MNVDEMISLSLTLMPSLRTVVLPDASVCSMRTVPAFGMTADCSLP